MSLNELGTTGTGGIDLGDKRINKRLIEFVDDSSRHIQSSIAQLGDSRHVSKAYYRLLANDKVDSYAVLEEHLKQVQSRAAKHPVVLCFTRHD
ncbi:MAG: hypothetical protein IPP76_04720 [Moraxellaceae bacterium]|nr:hypothetical protein [Moraxellaceae bacterium]